MFHFKMAKTTFHSGRLAAVFVPTTYDTTTASVVSILNTNFAYAYKTIIDVREGTEFSITVPYVRPDVWITSFDSLGTLQLYVLDALRRPETVSANVPIAVEVCAGPDFAVAVPKSTTYNPIVINAEYQSGIMSKECCLTSDGIGGITTPFSPIIDAEHISIGESVRSFRSLFRQWQYMKYTNNSIDWTANGTIPEQQTLVVYPYSIHLQFLSTSSVALFDNSGSPSNPRFVSNIINILSSAFAGFSGSMRIKAFFDNVTQGNDSYFFGQDLYSGTVATPFLVLVNAATNFGGSGPVFNGSSGISTTTGYTEPLKTSINGEIILESAPYMRNLVRPMVDANFILGGVITSRPTGRPIPRLYLSKYDAGFSTVNTSHAFFYRSIGEDFVLHNYLSLLPSTA